VVPGTRAVEAQVGEAVVVVAPDSTQVEKAQVEEVEAAEPRVPAPARQPAQPAAQPVVWAQLEGAS